MGLYGAQVAAISTPFFSQTIKDGVFLLLGKNKRS